MIRRPLLCAALLTGLLAVLPACGDGGGGEDASGGDDQHGAAVGPGTGPGTAVTVTAGDLFLKPAEVIVPAGPVDITYVNEGQLEHSLLVDEVRGLKLVAKRKGDEDTGRIKLEPGRYQFYCDVPGHRAAGMESRLTVE